MIQKTLTAFYWICFLQHFLVCFCTTTYVPFLFSIGLDKFEMTTINAMFMISIFFLELPTGTFADTFGRKKSFLISIIFMIIGFGFYFFANNLLMCWIAEFLAALHGVFDSGARDAWLVDTLKHHGYDGSLEKVFAKEKRYSVYGSILGGIIGAIIGKFSLRAPWMITAVGGIFLFVLSRKIMKEDYFVKQKYERVKDWLKHVFVLAKDSIEYGFKNKNVFNLISLHSGMVIGVQAFNMFWTLRLKQDFNQEYLGIMWFLIQGSNLLGTESIKIVINYFKKQKNILMFYVFIIAIGGFLSVIFYKNIYLLILFFLLHEAGRGGFGPIKKTYINKHIPSEKRATVLSFDSMVCKLGAFFGLLISGLLAKYFSIQIAWLFASIIIFLSSFICLKLNGDKH